MSINKVILVGNAGRDPEVRYIEGQGGQTKVATFTLATSERYRDRSGEIRESTEWHNIVAWRQPADIAEKYVRKGTQLYIEGKLRTRSWTDQAGVKKYTTEIQVDTLQLLGRRPEDSQYQGGYQAPQQPSYQQAPQQPRYSQPAQAPARPAAQAEAPIVLDAGDGSDDLPF